MATDQKEEHQCMYVISYKCIYGAKLIFEILVSSFCTIIFFYVGVNSFCWTQTMLVAKFTLRLPRHIMHYILAVFIHTCIHEWDYSTRDVILHIERLRLSIFSDMVNIHMYTHRFTHKYVSRACSKQTMNVRKMDHMC
jgi:hypothetical protein